MKKTYNVVLFTSKKKDNRCFHKFKERERAFLWEGETPPMDQFALFAAAGQVGEVCRCYVSVNPRDIRQARRDFMISMIANESIKDLMNIESMLANAASRQGNGKEYKWLLNLTSTDMYMQKEFLSDLSKTLQMQMEGGFIPKNTTVMQKKTPDGLSVVVSNGLDTVELLRKWGGVLTVERDGLLFYKQIQNTVNLSRFFPELLPE